MPKKSQSSTVIPADITTNETKLARAPSKAALVQGLLRRAEGASMGDLIAATGWQPHSARAFISGLRKSGVEVPKEKVDGLTRYRIAAAE